MLTRDRTIHGQDHRPRADDRVRELGGELRGNDRRGLPCALQRHTLGDARRFAVGPGGDLDGVAGGGLVMRVLNRRAGGDDVGARIRARIGATGRDVTRLC